MNKKLSISVIAFSAGLLAASSATAATLTVSQQSDVHVMYDSDDQNAWYAVTKYLVGTQEVTNVAAGAFRLTATDALGAAMDFLAFCLEPLEGLNHPSDHEMGSTFSDDINTRLNTLAAHAWQSVSDHRTAAAFQMAAWEIATETSAILDINAGHFQITGDSDMSDLAEATSQIWLDNIVSGTWAETNKSYMFLNAAGTQDLLTNIDMTPVPLPSSGLSLLAALGLGGVLARRRAKRSAQA